MPKRGFSQSKCPFQVDTRVEYIVYCIFIEWKNENFELEKSTCLGEETFPENRPDDRIV